MIIALTSGGPGISSDMPAVFMTTMAFHRSEVGLASASAIMMFLTVSAIVVPYLYSELKREDASSLFSSEYKYGTTIADTVKNIIIALADAKPTSLL